MNRWRKIKGFGEHSGKIAYVVEWLNNREFEKLLLASGDEITLKSEMTKLHKSVVKQEGEHIEHLKRELHNYNIEIIGRKRLIESSYNNPSNKIKVRFDFKFGKELKQAALKHEERINRIQKFADELNTRIMNHEEETRILKLHELYKEKYKQDNWIKATTTKYEVGQQLALF